jgi:hypothetical protein
MSALASRAAKVSGLRAAYAAGTCQGVPPISVRASACNLAPPFIRAKSA